TQSGQSNDCPLCLFIFPFRVSFGVCVTLADAFQRRPCQWVLKLYFGFCCLFSQSAQKCGLRLWGILWDIFDAPMAFGGLPINLFMLVF
ncbi:hypothetical protein, partial [Oscillibacter sp.]|uniref:hypothetical protein n=1 Tax=Oscillibacter sp. TaxID=1945593 RepID=UPI002899F11A